MPEQSTPSVPERHIESLLLGLLRASNRVDLPERHWMQTIHSGYVSLTDHTGRVVAICFGEGHDETAHFIARAYSMVPVMLERLGIEEPE